MQLKAAASQSQNDAAGRRNFSRKFPFCSENLAVKRLIFRREAIDSYPWQSHCLLSKIQSDISRK